MCVCLYVCVISFVCVICIVCCDTPQSNNIIKRSISFTFAFVFSQCIPVTQQPPLSLPPLAHTC